MTTPGLGTHLRRLAVASWLGLYAVVWAQPAKPVPVSMDVQGADLVSVLHGMANAAGVNLVVASGLSGKVNLHLQDVPWRQALQAVLAVGGLQAQSLGGVWWVAPQAQVVERAKQEAVLPQAQQQNRRMVSATLALHYARAADLLQTLQKARTAAATSGAADKSGQAAVGWLSPGGVVLADLRTNQLFVQDYPEQLQAIEAFVQQVDVPLRQVMIEAVIVRAEQSFGESLGARLAWQRGNVATATPARGSVARSRV